MFHDDEMRHAYEQGYARGREEGRLAGLGEALAAVAEEAAYYRDMATRLREPLAVDPKVASAAADEADEAADVLDEAARNIARLRSPARAGGEE